MKRMLLVILILSVAVLATLAAVKDRGYVLVDFHGWIIESSVIAMLVLWLLLLLAGYFGLRFITQILRAPRDMSAWYSHKKIQRATQSLKDGLLDYATGNWADAEKNLLRYAADADQPMLNFLTAARAAQELGRFERRDRYLNLANQHAGEYEAAVRLTQADLQIQQGQWEQALASLRQLNAEHPKHPWVLAKLVETNVQLGDWPSVLALLPDLKRSKPLNESQLQQWERQAHITLLQSAAAKHAAALEQQWSRVPPELRADATFLSVYVHHLVELGNSDIAEPLLRNALKQAWQDSLARLYGVISGADPAAQLRYAESWLPLREKNPIALLTLGRLAARNQLWGKARGYLEAAIGAGAPPEAFHALASLLESLGEHNAAAEICRKGLAKVPGCRPLSGPGSAAVLEFKGSTPAFMLKSN